MLWKVSIRFVHMYSSSTQFSTAHDSTWFKYQILHRDISVDNIIIADSSEGILIGWDLCIKFPPKCVSQTEELEEVTIAQTFAQMASLNLFSLCSNI